MTRTPDEVLSSHEALRALPPDVLASALIVALLEDEKDLAVTILTMVAVAAKMAKYLPVDLRTQIVWHLSEVIAELDARWH
jgi:hypothetical protein